MSGAVPLLPLMPSWHAHKQLKILPFLVSVAVGEKRRTFEC